MIGEGRVVEWSVKWAGLNIRGGERFCWWCDECDIEGMLLREFM